MRIKSWRKVFESELFMCLEKNMRPEYARWKLETWSLESTYTQGRRRRQAIVAEFSRIMATPKTYNLNVIWIWMWLSLFVLLIQFRYKSRDSPSPHLSPCRSVAFPSFKKHCREIGQEHCQRNKEGAGMTLRKLKFKLLDQDSCVSPMNVNTLEKNDSFSLRAFRAFKLKLSKLQFRVRWKKKKQICSIKMGLFLNQLKSCGLADSEHNNNQFIQQRFWWLLATWNKWHLLWQWDRGVNKNSIEWIQFLRLESRIKMCGMHENV